MAVRSSGTQPQTSRPSRQSNNNSSGITILAATPTPPPQQSNPTPGSTKTRGRQSPSIGKKVPSSIRLPSERGQEDSPTKGVWADDPNLNQRPGSAPSVSTPLSVGQSFSTTDSVTGKTTSVLAAYVFNGNGPGKGVGDGKQYTSAINGQTVTYLNGRLNFYSDLNNDKKIDAADKLITAFDPSVYSGLPNLTGKSGTWTLDKSNNLSLFSPPAETPLVVMKVAANLF